MHEPVLIAGAGPVGLVLALLLYEQGQDVRVYESVSELRPLGVGINLLPHSVRVLHGLGLDSELDRLAIRTGSLHYYNKHGQRIWAEPRGLEAGYRYPQYSIHRGELQLLLLRTVQARLGMDAVHTSQRLTGWQDSGENVTVMLAGADGNTTAVTGSVLIAADGINSTARRLLYPEEGPPIYGGRLLWRGVSEAAPFLDGRTMFMAGHQDCKFVAYPIANRGSRALINWIAELSAPNYQLDSQDWSRQVEKSEFSEPFQSWRFDWLDIPSLIESCEKVYEFPLADRDPLPAWTRGHMTLIGDAAHPMYPIGSNGASQGILDAETLARELARSQTLTTALAAYEAERRPATAKIVLLNRQNGPELVMQIAEERAPQGFEDIHTVIGQQELEEIAARYKQTAGFTVDAVNTRNK